MKKLIFLAVVAIGSMACVHAQGINLGVKAGVNFANLNGDVEDAKMRTSFHIGGVAEFQLSELFSFRPELLYSSQGTRQEIVEGAGDPDIITYKIDYLNIPLTAKINLTEWLSVQAAPQIGFLLDAVQESDNAAVETVEDLKALLKEIDFSLKIGAGYTAPSGLFFDAHYNLGLANINDLLEEGADFKNGVIQVSVGFLF